MRSAKQPSVVSLADYVAAIGKAHALPDAEVQRIDQMSRGEEIAARRVDARRAILEAGLPVYEWHDRTLLLGWPTDSATARATWCAQQINADALMAVERFLAVDPATNRKRLLLALIGDGGRGKTYALAYACSRILAEERGNSVIEYVSESSSRWTDHREEKALLTAQVLIVSEVGTTSDAKRVQAAHERIFDIVQRRVRNRTLFDGNVSKGLFSNRIDARLLDRFRQVGQITSLEGDSLRSRVRVKAAQTKEEMIAEAKK